MKITTLRHQLTFFYYQGFPKGSNIGEQERVSCPNAQYTKGDFMVSKQFLIWFVSLILLIYVLSLFSIIKNCFIDCSEVSAYPS